MDDFEIDFLQRVSFWNETFTQRARFWIKILSTFKILHRNFFGQSISIDDVWYRFLNTNTSGVQERVLIFEFRYLNLNF